MRVSLIACLLLAAEFWTGAAASFAQDDGAMRVAGAVAAPGDTVEVEVHGQAPFPVASLSFAVGHHTEQVTLLEVRPGQNLVDHGVETFVPKVNNAAAEPYGALFVVVDDCCPMGDTPPLDLSQDTVLATLVYEVRADAAEGETILDLRNWHYGEPRPIHCMFGDTQEISHFPALTSASIVVQAAGKQFLRGDANRDVEIDISDAVAVLGSLFGGYRPGCLDAADANDDGRDDISDAIYLLSYLFRGGSPPPPPFPGVGPDPTEDALDCAEYGHG